MSDQVVEATYGRLVHGDSQSVTTDHGFTLVLKSSTRRVVLYSLLRVLTQIYLCTRSGVRGEEANVRIGGVAALLHELIRSDDDLANIVREWLSSDGVLQDIQIRRAVIASLAGDIGKALNSPVLINGC